MLLVPCRGGGRCRRSRGRPSFPCTPPPTLPTALPRAKPQNPCRSLPIIVTGQVLGISGWGFTKRNEIYNGRLAMLVSVAGARAMAFDLAWRVMCVLAGAGGGSDVYVPCACRVQACSK